MAGRASASISVVGIAIITATTVVTTGITGVTIRCSTPQAGCG
jgi:hypothetical protein